MPRVLSLSPPPSLDPPLLNECNRISVNTITSTAVSTRTSCSSRIIDMNVPPLAFAFAPLFLVWTSLVVGEYESMEVHGGWNVRSLHAVYYM